MNSTAFLLSANSNSKVDGNQISFGTVDFQPHPPTLTPVFASLDQEMDLTIGSLNFCVGSLGSIRLSDLTKSDRSAGKTATMAISESSVGSFSEINSQVSFTTIENIEEKIEELDEIMGNLDLGEAMDHSSFSQIFSKNTLEDFTTRNGGVSSNVHQVCVIITEAAEQNDGVDNIVVNTQGNNPRSNSRKEKEKIYVSAREWRIIMSAINHGTEVPADLRREVLMGYQYALHQQKKKLREEKSELRRSQEDNSASSRSYWDKYSETSDSSEERHHEPKHSRRKTTWPRKEDRAKSINTPLLDEEEDFIQEMPEAAVVAAHAYLLTMQPEPRDPQEHMHQAAIKILELVGDELKQKSSGKKSTYHEHTGRRSRRCQSPQSQRTNSPGKTDHEARREDARNIITQARVNKARYAWDAENYEDKDKEMGALCFTQRVCRTRVPKGFKLPHDQQKYDGSQEPKLWLSDYLQAVQILGGSRATAMQRLQLHLTGAARPWLSALPDDSIRSWGELENQFTRNFRSMYKRPA
jgi:hypothetical protein